MPENCNLPGQPGRDPGGPHWEANDDFVGLDDIARRVGNDPTIFARQAQLRDLAAAAATGRTAMLEQIETAQRAAILTALGELSAQLARVVAALQIGAPGPAARRAPPSL